HSRSATGSRPSIPTRQRSTTASRSSRGWLRTTSRSRMSSSAATRPAAVWRRRCASWRGTGSGRCRVRSSSCRHGSTWPPRRTVRQYSDDLFERAVEAGDNLDSLWDEERMPFSTIDQRVTDLLDLRGRKVVITGGGGKGLGQACANRFAGLGADVALVDLKVD